MVNPARMATMTCSRSRVKGQRLKVKGRAVTDGHENLVNSIVRAPRRGYAGRGCIPHGVATFRTRVVGITTWNFYWKWNFRQRISTRAKVQKNSVVKTWISMAIVRKIRLNFELYCLTFRNIGSEFFRARINPDSRWPVILYRDLSLSPRATVHCIIRASLRWLHYQQVT